MTADGPDSASVDELSGSVRTPMGHHQTVLSHHNRVNSFGDDPGGQDGTFGDSMGESREKLSWLELYLDTYIFFWLLFFFLFYC